MAEKPSTTKDELLEGVIAYLAENGLAGATLRSIAAFLNISTYPLIYYFRSKEGLLNAVVAEVERRQSEFVNMWLSLEGTMSHWDWCIQNQELLRLDLEILLQESRRSRDRRLAKLVLTDWREVLVNRMVSLGLSEEEARIEATLLVALGIGLQVDLLATGDTERTTKAFEAQQQRKIGRFFPLELSKEFSRPKPGASSAYEGR